MTLPTPDAAFRWSHEPWGSALRCRPLENVAEHLFTSRQLALRTLANAPQAAAVSAWTLAAASIGAHVGQVMRVKQVHGRTVRVLRRGEASPQASEARPEADALISNDATVVLAVQVADCVPLLMADAATGVAAAVHAGWRGTRAGIASAAIEAMSAEFGTRPQDLTVALGPSIGPCCYEVGEDLLTAFREAGATDDELRRWFLRTANGSLRLDLWSVNRDQLLAAGVPASQIFLSGLCTQTHAEIFDSYRADGERAGRMAALISVPTPQGSGIRFSPPSS